MYHWESPKVEGFFEKIKDTWYAFVNCEKYSLFPEMLAGRVITIKGQRRRIADPVAGGRLDKVFFNLWPANIGSFVPPPWITHAARLLYSTSPENQEKRIFELRQKIKDCASQERRRREIIPPWPSVEAFQHWALEYLDSVLCSMWAAGLLAEDPPNGFKRATTPDIQSLALELFKKPLLS